MGMRVEQEMMAHHQASERAFVRLGRLERELQEARERGEAPTAELVEAYEAARRERSQLLSGPGR